VDVPGGQDEPGESPENAAVRETLEETGLRTHATEVIGSRLHLRTGVRIVCVALVLTSGADGQISEVLMHSANPAVRSSTKSGGSACCKPRADGRHDQGCAQVPETRAVKMIPALKPEIITHPLSPGPPLPG
jgi:ADP-ribose pyrophosphatase YjhB (NUDIX family)